ncbi:MAG: hypothetical protein KGS10_18715 [Chloroflexi bacterium]|jgi:hypothetical protein|nr:hypothetical protein [Chloroflexota bacterium]
MSEMTASLVVDVVGLAGVALLVIGVGMWSIPAALITLGIVGIVIWIGALGASRRSSR